MHIIEYLGKIGIKTTNASVIRSRWSTPMPGDVVDFGELKGTYPFLHSQYGTISTVGEGFVGPDEAHICSHMGSIFLLWNSEKKEPRVSISGGPFTTIKLSRLKPTYAVRVQNMWNWGDNLPGADQGVYFQIARPVFKLTPQAGDKF